WKTKFVQTDRQVLQLLIRLDGSYVKSVPAQVRELPEWVMPLLVRIRAETVPALTSGGGEATRARDACRPIQEPAQAGRPKIQPGRKSSRKGAPASARSRGRLAPQPREERPHPRPVAQIVLSKDSDQAPLLVIAPDQHIGRVHGGVDEV